MHPYDCDSEESDVLHEPIRCMMGAPLPFFADALCCLHLRNKSNYMAARNKSNYMGFDY